MPAFSGQANVAVDRSGTSTPNNVYMLASLRTYNATNGADVMFVRSTDGGATFSAARLPSTTPSTKQMALVRRTRGGS